MRTSKIEKQMTTLLKDVVDAQVRATDFAFKHSIPSDKMDTVYYQLRDSVDTARIASYLDQKSGSKLSTKVGVVCILAGVAYIALTESKKKDQPAPSA